jgi:hypothetical protein
MNSIECEREDDVLAAVRTGRWPDRIDAELRAHVANCSTCHDVLVVAAAFIEDAEVPSAHLLPDSQVMWLRAQIRARADATRLAERPITVAQALAFASVVGVLGALVGASSSWLQAGFHSLGQAVSHLEPGSIQLPTAVAAALTEHLGLVALVAAALMITPVAVYWAIRDS